MTPLTLTALLMAMPPWPATALHAAPANALAALHAAPANALAAMQATPAALQALQAPVADATSAGDVNLLLISVFAFLAVFMVLATLALLMVALTRLFPAPLPDDDVDGPDAAVIAAISAAASVAYPGMRVTRVEESR